MDFFSPDPIRTHAQLAASGAITHKTIERLFPDGSFDSAPPELRPVLARRLLERVPSWYHLHPFADKLLGEILASDEPERFMPTAHLWAPRYSGSFSLLSPLLDRLLGPDARARFRDHDTAALLLHALPVWYPRYPDARRALLRLFDWHEADTVEALRLWLFPEHLPDGALGDPKLAQYFNRFLLRHAALFFPFLKHRVSEWRPLLPNPDALLAVLVRHALVHCPKDLPDLATGLSRQDPAGESAVWPLFLRFLSDPYAWQNNQSPLRSKKDYFLLPGESRASKFLISAELPENIWDGILLSQPESRWPVFLRNPHLPPHLRSQLEVASAF